LDLCVAIVDAYCLAHLIDFVFASLCAVRAMAVG
jgi:hypothetical protein